jgi:hypothetical protein
MGVKFRSESQIKAAQNENVKNFISDDFEEINANDKRTFVNIKPFSSTSFSNDTTNELYSTNETKLTNKQIIQNDNTMKINISISTCQYDFIMELINNYVIDQDGVDEFVGETLKDLENAYSRWNESSILHNIFILSEDEDSEIIMSAI